MSKELAVTHQQKLTSSFLVFASELVVPHLGVCLLLVGIVLVSGVERSSSLSPSLIELSENQ